MADPRSSNNPNPVLQTPNPSDIQSEETKDTVREHLLQEHGSEPKTDVIQEIDEDNVLTTDVLPADFGRGNPPPALLEEHVGKILDIFVDSLNKPKQEFRRWVRHHLNDGDFFNLFAETFEPSDEFSDICHHESGDRS